MPTSLPNPDAAHFLDIDAIVSAPFDTTPVTPCELLAPIMRGVMAVELAGMVITGGE